jgi:hypothetical protein
MTYIYMSLHEIIVWIDSWISCPTIGYMVDCIPFKKNLITKYMIELDDLEALPTRDELDESYINTYKKDILSYGQALFENDTIDMDTIRSYMNRLEFTKMEQQYSAVHQVYIISDKCTQSLVEQHIEYMFILYEEGHSELHSLFCTYQLKIPKWIERETAYGYVYHHPYYIAYRMQTIVSDRSYKILLTNCESSYKRYHPDHLIKDITLPISNDTRIMYQCTEVDDEISLEFMMRTLEYDTPVCIYGMLPYFTFYLPNLFQLRVAFVFPEEKLYPVYIIRGVYTPLPDEIQQSMKKEPCIKAFIKDIKEGKSNIDYTTITLSILPEEWKKTFYRGPYYLIKITAFTRKSNLLLTKHINELLQMNK